MQGYHPSPADYRRYTEEGLRAELSDYEFEVVESGVAVGPASAMAWVVAEFLAFLVSGRSERVYRLARPVSRWLSAADQVRRSVARHSSDGPHDPERRLGPCSEARIGLASTPISQEDPAPPTTSGAVRARRLRSLRSDQFIT